MDNDEPIGFLIPEEWRETMLKEISRMQRFGRPDMLERSIRLLLRQIGRINYYFWFNVYRIKWRFKKNQTNNGFTKFLKWIKDESNERAEIS